MKLKTTFNDLEWELEIKIIKNCGNYIEATIEGLSKIYKVFLVACDDSWGVLLPEYNYGFILESDKNYEKKLIAILKNIADTRTVCEGIHFILQISGEEKISAIELENKVKQLFFANLKKKLEIEKTACEMKGVSMQPFINSIKNIIKKYDNSHSYNKLDENQLSLFDSKTEKGCKQTESDN